MKFINELLYIEFKDFLAAGWKEDTIKKANLRNGPLWQMVENPEDRRKPLVQYETLREEHKAKLFHRFGNPYDYYAKQPIRDLVEKDFKAEAFYREYRYNGNTPLPTEHISRYTTAASWLNLLLKLNDKNGKQFVKKTLNLSLDKFYDCLSEIFATDKIELPTNSRKLRAKMYKYQGEGYACLIDWRFGNKNSAKIGKAEGEFDEEIAGKQIALIRKAKTLHNNLDAVQITRTVNAIFEKNGWATVSDATVKNILSKYEHITTPGARGKRVWESKFAMQVKREAPKYPLLYWTLDGWTVELLYQDETGYNNRMVMVVVLDPCTKYPIGYAIGERENTELIRQANRNALLHVQQIFGKAYKPMQVQSDRYGLKNLTPFYEGLTHLFTPAAVRNAKSKVVEPYFRYLNKKYCQEKFRNWSGFNITASQDNQPNIEYLDKIKHEFPDKQGVIKQIEMIMQQERRSKFSAYREAFNNAPDTFKTDLKEVGLMDQLMIFGQPHRHPRTGKELTNSITGQGIIWQLNNMLLTHDCFDPEFRANQHLKWKLVYDENDLKNIVALSEDGKQKFLLHQKQVVPMDIYSTTNEHRTYLKQIRDFNAERREEVIQTYISDDAIAQEVLQNTPLSLDDKTEGALKLMFTVNGQQKEGIQDAKRLIENKNAKRTSKQKAVEHKAEESSWNDTQLAYLQSKTDFNKYLD